MVEMVQQTRAEREQLESQLKAVQAGSQSAGGDSAELQDKLQDALDRAEFAESKRQQMQEKINQLEEKLWSTEKALWDTEGLGVSSSFFVVFFFVLQIALMRPSRSWKQRFWRFRKT